MTAIAFAPDTAFDARLDVFDDELFETALGRPQLRLIQGGLHQGSLHQGSVGRNRAVPSPQVEIYRRRRFLALITLTIAILAITQLAGISLLSMGATAAPVANEAAPAVHVVLPGDSYGAIAAELGASNPATAAALIQAANGGGELVIGQRIVVDPALLN